MPIVLGTETQWWYLYLIEFLEIVAVGLILPFVPESPRFVDS